MSSDPIASNAAGEKAEDRETALITCGTTVGSFTMELHRAWSPMGYDRAVELFERHFYDHSHFYRAVPGFLVQFGITYNPSQELKHFANTPIPDDPPRTDIPFVEGTISYAGSGDNSRTSQLFISYGSHKMLGTQKWETPIGKVVDGMEHVRNFYSYGDMPPWGKGPVQGKIHSGRQYIEENFPLIDKFLECTVKRSNGSLSSSDTAGDGGGGAAATAREELPKEEAILREKEEDWSALPVKKKAEQDDSKLHHTPPLKDHVKQAYRTLRSKVQDPDSSYDLLAMGLILVVILIAVAIKASLKKKDSSKTS